VVTNMWPDRDRPVCGIFVKRQVERYERPELVAMFFISVVTGRRSRISLRPYDS